MGLDGSCSFLRARRELLLQAVRELRHHLRRNVLDQAAAVLGDRARKLQVGDDVNSCAAVLRRQSRLDRRLRIASPPRFARFRGQLRAARGN
jgi:hypothetical protein